MTRAVHSEVERPTKSVNRRLTFGIAAAPIAWFLFEVVAFSIFGRNCSFEGDLAPWQWVVIIATIIITIGLAVAGGLVSLRVFRHWGRSDRVTEAEGWDRVEFTALLGIFTSAILLLNIIYFSVLPLVLEPCLSVI